MSIHIPRLSLTTLAALALFACDAEITTEAAGTTHEAPTEGVTESGEQVIFAGAQSATKRAPSESEGDAPERPVRDDEDELIREPTEPDPEAGDFTLEEAIVGMPIDGSLVAEIGTEFGAILCDLYADRAPRTVANFIGLARGTRPWWDARAGQWRRTPYYRGLTFHRVIPGFLIQGGDYLADGSGTVGYTLEDEEHDTLSHDRAGILAMASHDGADSGGAQFFISDGPAPQLDAADGYTIFGDCRPLAVIAQLARVPQNPDLGNRPLTDVHMGRVMIRRVEGGAANASPTQPQLPEGEPETPTGARGPFDPRQYGRPSPMPNGRTGPPLPPRVNRGGHAGHNH